jgi:hypothetical protein
VLYACPYKLERSPTNRAEIHKRGKEVLWQDGSQTNSAKPLYPFTSLLLYLQFDEA